jgi:hypothetical protein
MNDGSASLSDALTCMIEAYGKETVAEFLGIDGFVIEQWALGHQNISAEMRQRIINLRLVLTRTYQVWPPQLAGRWLPATSRS